MAEALIAKDHFYVNASYYNDTDTDQPATIMVEDNEDILRRDEGDQWLVHVTRFSCDSMTTLSYIKADLTATWEIVCHDGTGFPKAAFLYTLERDFATPRDFIASMNLRTRFVAIARKIYVESFRFELDAGGRFKLSMPFADVMEDNGWYITFKASQAMHDLLGFKQITPFLTFTPDPAARFCRALETLERECNTASTVWNHRTGDLYEQTNRCLVYLLNGLECLNQFDGSYGGGLGSVPATLADLDMNNTNWQNFLHHTNFLPVFKGVTPSQHSRTAGQAQLPKTMVPVMCQYYTTRTNNTQPSPTIPVHGDPRDDGPKITCSKIEWAAGSDYEGVAGGGVTGYVRFRDFVTNMNTTPAHWPLIKQGSREWTNSKFVYPLDSIPGYAYSGDNGFAAGAYSVCVSSLTPSIVGHGGKNFTLENPIPDFIKVGHDIWMIDHCAVPGLNVPGIAHQHGIEYISADRLNIGVDWTYGLNSGFHTNPDLLFTNRRIPYQTRSQIFRGITSVTVFDDRKIIVTRQNTNASVGDRITFLGDIPDNDEDVVKALAETSYEITAIFTDNNAKQIHIAPDAATLVGDYIEFFIDKSKWDKIRWAQDTARMKRAATTFSYQGYDQETFGDMAPHTVNGIVYAKANFQRFDAVQLGKQVDSFSVQLKQSRVFHGSVNYANLKETLEMKDELLVTIPESSAETVYGGGIDFKAREVRAADTNLGPGLPLADILSRTVRGILPHELTERLPSPWFGVKMYEEVSLNTLENEERGRVNAFISDNPNDKPHMHMHVSALNTATHLRFTSYPTNPNLSVSPIITGVAKTTTWQTQATTVEEPRFIVWIPTANPLAPIDFTSTFASETTVKYATFGINYDSLTRAYQVCKKEHDAVTLVPDSTARLYGEDGDYIASEKQSHVDRMFPWRQLILTSDDLMQVPERSQDAASKQPVLSSYTLPTMGSVSVDAQGKPAGGSSQPFGTIYFSEGGTRRFHHMINAPGGLRRFKINAALTYKDHSKPAKDVMLGPGGQFTCQILFMKKEKPPAPAPAPAPAPQPGVFPDPRNAPSYQTMA